MIKTATNIIKGVFRHTKPVSYNFKKISWVQEKILKHADDQTIKKFKVNDLTFHYKRPYEFLHAYQDIFLNEIYRFTSANTVPLIIDCGSNIGMSILYFKQIFPKARIIAFEPDPVNFDLLQQNVHINHLENIELNQAAVWIRDGEISFQSNESEASHIIENEPGNEVKATHLNRLLQQHTMIDFLKVDIEGAEYEVMKDCSENLHKVENLFLEYHGKIGETYKFQELFTFIQKAGFHVYIRNAADHIRHPFVEKRTNLPYDVQLNLFCYKRSE